MKKSGADILRLWVAASDYSDDLRIGPEILKHLRRHLPQAAQHAALDARHAGALDPGERVKFTDMRDARAGAADAASPDRARRRGAQGLRDVRLPQGRRRAVAVHEHRAVGLLFRHPQGRALLRALLEHQAPRRPHRHRRDLQARSSPGWRRSCRSPPRKRGWRASPAARARSTSRRSPSSIPRWRDDELAEKWDLVRNVRRVVTGALELERAAKRIGSSLEAAPEVYVADRDMLRALEGVDLAEVSITSGARLIAKAPPEGAFTLARRAGRRRRAQARRGQEVRPLVAHHSPTSAPTRPTPTCRRATPPPCASSTNAPSSWARTSHDDRHFRGARLAVGAVLAAGGRGVSRHPRCSTRPTSGGCWKSTTSRSAGG